MGIYDRDYYREERPLFAVGAPRSAVGVLIAVNVAFWIVNFFTPGNAWLTVNMAVSGSTLTEPWMWWQFLTYGFAHSPTYFSHIFFNMFGLFVFGRDLESRYGRSEFVRFYLSAIVFGGIVWALINQIQSGFANSIVFGASGAVVATVVLFALCYPHRTILLFFVIPTPAWVLGLLLVGMDIYGALNRPESHVAYTVHLAGAAFAFAYFRMGWNLGRVLPSGFRLPQWLSRTKLRIHDPDEDATFDLSEEVDRILEKIHREGEASLTRKERRTIETASREYRRRQQQR